MQEYVCTYLTDATHGARAVYLAESLPGAMAAHNTARSEHADKVLKWVGPTGITFLMHDSKLRVDAD